MPVDADTAALALTRTWEHLLTGMQRGWGKREGGALAGVSGVPLATLNGVWVSSTDADAETVAGLLERVASTGLPHCLQVRPHDAERLGALAVARGMTAEGDVPLMVLDGPPDVGGESGLAIRELAPAEAQLHARVAAVGFEVPEQLFIELMTPAVLSLPGVRCYVGEIGAEVVTTGLGVTLDSGVGIFNIATLPEHRRSGHGAAVTARAVNDGLAAGATWSWLQSSRAGYGVYERLGFVSAEEWSCWISGDSPGG